MVTAIVLTAAFFLSLGIFIGVREGKEIGARYVMVEHYGETAVQYAEVKYHNFKEVLAHLKEIL